MIPKNFSIPPHVLRPGRDENFIPLAQHRLTYRAGLGYAILRALGVRENLDEWALEIVAKWSTDYGRYNKNITPSVNNLIAQSFSERVGPKWSADVAAENASCYPGGRGGRPSYADIFREVWIEQRWPELCHALTGSHKSGTS